MLRFVINCADNSEAKTLKIFASKKIQASLNRLPSASVGDMVLVSCKKVNQIKKKVLYAGIVRQRKPWRRRDGYFIYFQNNAGVIVLNKEI